MSLLQQSARLRKELSLFSVYAIATGTTLSAGFFLLPGLAAEQAGSAVILCYMLAGALVVPPMLSIVELATAMPRAGGAYYFLDRSLGPLAGTIGGLGIWLAGNNLSGGVPVELGNLSNLTFLSLENNQLNGSLPQSLTTLNLEIFRFNDTNLCEPPDTGFQTWLSNIDTLQRTQSKCNGGSGG